jgi:hypothetical protein
MWRQGNGMGKNQMILSPTGTCHASVAASERNLSGPDHLQDKVSLAVDA